MKKKRVIIKIFVIIVLLFCGFKIIFFLHHLTLDRAENTLKFVFHFLPKYLLKDLFENIKCFVIDFP